MESQILSTNYIKQKPRWDFRYFEPKYLAAEQQIKTGKYSVESLNKYVSGIDNFGAYSLCNLLEWVDEGIPYIRVTDLKEDGVDWETVPHIPFHVHEQLPKSKVLPRDVLYSMAGTIGLAVVAPDELGECNSNQAIAKIRLRSDDLDPYYLAAFLNSRLGRYQSERIANGQTVLNINLGEIGLLEVPIPPRKVQNYIAKSIRNAYEERRQKLASINEYLRGIDGAVFYILNIFPQNVQEDRYFLMPLNRSLRNRFDVAYNMGFKKFDPFIESVSPISLAVDFTNRLVNPTDQPEVTFKYIDISSIDVHLGEIRQAKEIIGAEAPSRARQLVRAGDIIISTVRPTRGATALVPDEMDGFVCSTGFVVVRPAKDVIAEYLHIALRLGTTLEQFGRYSSGSSYPAILEKDIKQTIIPLPPVDVQQKVVKEISVRRSEAKRLIAEADDLILQSKLRIERIILGEENVV